MRNSVIGEQIAPLETIGIHLLMPEELSPKQLYLVLIGSEQPMHFGKVTFVTRKADQPNADLALRLLALYGCDHFCTTLTPLYAIAIPSTR